MPAPRQVAILKTGLVTSVGLSAPATCAAIRAGLTNHTDTRFSDGAGDWIVGAQVALERPWRGREKLAQMLCMALDECLAPVGSALPEQLPTLLCVAEAERPGRHEGLDEVFLGDVLGRVGITPDPALSSILPHGRPGVAVALANARTLLHEQRASHVLIAAADSLLQGPTLKAFDQQDRLLSEGNTNGFIPGEAAGAVLVARDGAGIHLACLGLGFGTERATVTGEHPFRGEGLTAAINEGLTDAGYQMHDMDFRITDNSGEQFYFKEAALALTRAMKVRKAEFDIWHPADCIGETGAAIGVVTVAVALASVQKGYAPGPTILVHLGNDAGHRAAVVLRSSEGR